ncbi:MAG: cytochrome c3 family protein [Myxococcota bacterium]
MRWPLVFGAVLAATALAGACATLLGIREDAPEPFPHHAHAVEGIACVQCHEGISSAGEEGPLHLPDADSCEGCHEDPHDTRSCVECHTLSSTPRRLAESRKYLRFRHDTHLEELHGNCVRCHTGVGREGGEATAPMAACLGCHEHKDEFAIRQCDQCHMDLHTEVAFPETHLVHDAHFVRQHGVQAASAGDLCSSCHRESFCAECHGVTVPELPVRMRFTETVGRTLHRANFFARHAEEARGSPGLCSTCHAERFCADCHLDEEVHATIPGARNPHPPGWVGALSEQNAHGPAARRDPASCAGCHGGGGQMLCVRCHQVGGIGGSVHPPGWSSRKDMTDLPCRLCHLPFGSP